MTTLEELIRQAAERGLTHFSLSHTTTGGWHAVAAPSTQHQYVSEVSRDPVAAMTAALEKLPKAPKRRLSAKGITATVTEPAPEPEEGG